MSTARENLCNNFRQRLPRKRYELKPDFLFDVRSSELEVIENHGKFMAGSMFGNELFEYLSVKYDGRIWPCCRKVSEDNRFTIWHMREFFSKEA